MMPCTAQRMSSSYISCSPACPTSDTGPGASIAPARSKKGLLLSTVTSTVGLQRIRSGRAMTTPVLGRRCVRSHLFKIP